jgi:hypothetical protein
VRYRPAGTCSSSAGLMTGMPVTQHGGPLWRVPEQRKRGSEAAIGPTIDVGQPSRAVAARAVNVQLQAVPAGVAYRLEWKLADHGREP